MHLMIVTDAWHPQINGVVRTLEAVKEELERLNHTVTIVSPELESRRTRCLPSYPEIKLEFFAHRRVKKLIDAHKPDAIHIATEGPLGWAARRVCLQSGLSFTTCYHTRFPEYLAKRFPKAMACFVQRWAFDALRRFHAASKAVMVPTATMESELKQRGFTNLVLWARGISPALFRPLGKELSTFDGLPRPILLCVGRVSVEKNLKDFLTLETSGSKVVIGDGPDLGKLKKQFPKAHFLGVLEGEALARHYSAADVFVFPSQTDTFGLVLLEACACGLRVASYPSPGPVDLFMNKSARPFAVLHTNLQKAVDGALRLKDDPAVPHAFAQQHTWRVATSQFLEIVVQSQISWPLNFIPTNA